MKNLFLFAIMILFFATLVNAQIPDKFENLQVLPKDISKGELMGNMKSFALGLGVRCQFCHVGEEGQPLSEFDFVSDEKETKKKARVMIQMRDAINNQYLTQLGEENALEVNCVTCHHGQEEPKSIAQVMNESIEKDGIDAAIGKYRELREQFYGGFTYDFNEMPLSSVGSGLARAGKNDEAVAVLNLNLEFHPNSFMTHFMLGEALAKKGEKEAAIKSFQKANEINPNPRIQRRIDELSKK